VTGFAAFGVLTGSLSQSKLLQNSFLIADFRAIKILINDINLLLNNKWCVRIILSKTARCFKCRLNKVQQLS
jgi:hypothetical protein